MQAQDGCECVGWGLPTSTRASPRTSPLHSHTIPSLRARGIQHPSWQAHHKLKAQESGRVGTCDEHKRLLGQGPGPWERYGRLRLTPGLNSHVNPASEPLSPPPCPHLSLSLCHSLGYFLPCPCNQFSFGKIYNRSCHFNRLCLFFIGV